MTGNGVGNSFEFVVLASLRVRQLVEGCTPRLDSEAKVAPLDDVPPAPGVQRSDQPRNLVDMYW